MNRSLSRMFSVLIILALMLTALPMQGVQAISPDIVISQIYGGGGNSGATLTNDFIELFNRGSSPVSLAGWSVQYASAAGTSWQVTALAGTVQPGQYYLVQEAAGAGGSTPLPTPDATGSIAMSATAGKVALVNSTTALTDTGCPFGASIIDFIGYGGSANCFEGAGPAPAPSNTIADLRAGAGCTETDNNSADFATGAPTPRNTASPLNPCPTGDNAPSVSSTTPADGATNVAVDANIDIAFSEAVDVTGSWFDISCGASDAHTATVSGGPTTFTLDPDTDFANSESCTVTVLAAQVTDQDTDDPPDNMEADYIFGFDTAGLVVAPEIMITEIMYDPNSAEPNWEWIEIYNAGGSSVDLTGFVVDDNNSVAHSAANIAGGTLAADEQAVLYNVDNISAADFQAAWGTVNLIPVTNWTTTAMALNNTGDRVSLWKSFSDYSGNNTTHANAIDTVNYDGAGFPDPVGASIYLTDLGADNNVGSNWATSTVGGVTPLFTGYQSLAAGGNVGTDVGSPGTPVTPVDVIINEVDSDTPGTDALEFVELYDGGSGNTSLNGFVVVFFNGSNDLSYAAFDLDGHSTDANGYFLLGNVGVIPTPSITFAGNFLQNGADAVALYDANALDFPNGTAVTTSNLVDAVVYDTDDADDPGLLVLLNAGQAQVNEGGGGDSAGQSIQRCPNGSGGARNTDAYTQEAPTPGSENCPPPPPEMCGDPVTHFIYEIQGSGPTSPLAGMEVAIEAIVVGDFQNNASPDNGDLNGFYIQEEDAEADADPATSDGIFVFAPGGIDVSVGDKVRVRGTVSEFGTSSSSTGDSVMTELTGVSTLLVCETSVSLPAPTPITLPVTSVSDFERYEGMLVTFPQALTISEFFNFDRFNEIVLTVDRQFQPTAIFEPGTTDAANLALANSLSRITLDDGRSTQNPDPAIHPNGSVFDLTNRFRGGDTVQNATGVIDDTFGIYRIQPTEAALYTVQNPRPAAPENVGGSLQVASFNVLNYFLTIDTGPDICGPSQNQDCRGADTAEEFDRQRAKILSALSAIDADIFGLIEMENTTGVEPLADIVAGLNDELGPGTYDYIDTATIGTDAIKVGIIYKPGTVTSVGDYAILDSSVDSRFDDSRSRPVLAQTFEENATGARFTVAVNHLKSKGSACGGPPDDDPQQGNCNGTRTRAAEALVDWLASDPTASGDADFLIMGDLNAYDKEDPIDVIRAGADDVLGTADDYTDLIFKYQGEFAYSFLFDGQLGYLDHALAIQNLAEQVTGATEWHINADEPDILDYDMTFKQDAQDALFEPNPYRSSDHDPVVVGLKLHYLFTGFFPPIENLPTFNVVKAGSGIPIKFSLNGDQGLNIFAAGYPKSEKIACPSSTDPTSGVDETVTAGSSGLSYDPLTDTYTYVWKTNKSWANTCRQLVIKLDDGTFHLANFQFTR